MKDKIEINEEEWEASKNVLDESKEVRDNIPRSMEIDLSEDAKKFILRPGIHCAKMKMEKGLFESYAYGKREKGIDKALNKLPVAPKAVQLFKNHLVEKLGRVDDLNAAFLYFSTWHNDWMNMLDTEWEHYFVPAHVKKVTEDHVIVEDPKDPERMVNKTLPVEVCQWIAIHGNEICAVVDKETADKMNSIVKRILLEKDKLKENKRKKKIKEKEN